MAQLTCPAAFARRRFDANHDWVLEERLSLKAVRPSGALDRRTVEDSRCPVEIPQFRDVASVPRTSRSLQTTPRDQAETPPT